jgi:hypothetical protein
VPSRCRHIAGSLIWSPAHPISANRASAGSEIRVAVILRCSRFGFPPVEAAKDERRSGACLENDRRVLIVATPPGTGKPAQDLALYLRATSTPLANHRIGFIRRIESSIEHVLGMPIVRHVNIAPPLRNRLARFCPDHRRLAANASPFFSGRCRSGIALPASSKVAAASGRQPPTLNRFTCVCRRPRRNRTRRTFALSPDCRGRNDRPARYRDRHRRCRPPARAGRRLQE